jgi:hypothetical protein
LLEFLLEIEHSGDGSHRHEEDDHKENGKGHFGFHACKSHEGNPIEFFPSNLGERPS